MMTYIQVINSLSKHGYGALTSDVLNLVKNREWLSLGRWWCEGQRYKSEFCLLLFQISGI